MIVSGGKSNFCFFTLGFLATGMHSHWWTMHRWQGLPESQARRAFMQLAQALRIPFGIVGDKDTIEEAP